MEEEGPPPLPASHLIGVNQRSQQLNTLRYRRRVNREPQEGYPDRSSAGQRKYLFPRARVVQARLWLRTGGRRYKKYQPNNFNNNLRNVMPNWVLSLPFFLHCRLRNNIVVEQWGLGKSYAGITNWLIGTSDQWLVGQGRDAKSNLCPSPVKSLSNACPKKGLVEVLSRPGLRTVQDVSNLCQVP